MYNLNELQQSISDDVTQSVTDQLVDTFSWIIIPSLLITIVFVIFFIYRSIRRYQLEKAIFEMRDTLRELKLSQQPSSSQYDTQTTNTIPSRHT